MAPNYTLGVWKAPAAPASILYPPTTPPQPGCMCWPTSTLTLLPGVANSSQPDGTISGRCQESKMMNYEYPGDVDRIPALGEKKISFFSVPFLGSQISRQILKECVVVWSDWFLCLVINGVRLKLGVLVKSSRTLCVGGPVWQCRDCAWLW